ncbi:RNA polymerase sigma-70 factor [Sphingobacterium thalpophilum]|uniref:RNA polymerase sigma-70 factor n=1 Tax=Sphingobacterium thalpophilum TaxID=259 RepID=A0ABV4HGI1_9SPHI|nr:RNA polymerase sigma-70 factor [Sphingobacterium thalpophilum]
MKRKATATNEQLLEQLRQGDKAAFQELYFRMRNKVMGFSYKFLRSQEDAKELTQEIFVKLWENREKIESSKNIETLLYVMVRYSMLDLWKRKLRYDNFLETQSRVEQHHDSTAQYIDYQECYAVLSKSIESLPQQAQKVYRLSREEGLSHQQIAEQLQISTHTVSNHIKRSMRQIRAYYNNSYPEAFGCILGLIFFLV